MGGVINSAWNGSLFQAEAQKRKTAWWVRSKERSINNDSQISGLEYQPE